MEIHINRKWKHITENVILAELYLEASALQAFHKTHHRSDCSFLPTSHMNFQAILY